MKEAHKVALSFGLVGVFSAFVSCHMPRVNGPEDAARALCCLRHITDEGVTAEYAEEALCATFEQVQPWLEPAKKAAEEPEKK